MKKKIISLLATLALLLCIVPAGALAETSTPPCRRLSPQNGLRPGGHK